MNKPATLTAGDGAPLHWHQLPPKVQAVWSLLLKVPTLEELLLADGALLRDRGMASPADVRSALRFLILAGWCREVAAAPGVTRYARATPYAEHAAAVVA